MRHITRILKGEPQTNFMVKCDCGYRCSVATLSKDFAENSAYNHTREEIEADLFTTEELMVLSAALHSLNTSSCLALLPKIQWLTHHKSAYRRLYRWV